MLKRDIGSRWGLDSKKGQKVSILGKVKSSEKLNEIIFSISVIVDGNPFL